MPEPLALEEKQQLRHTSESCIEVPVLDDLPRTLYTSTLEDCLACHVFHPQVFLPTKYTALQYNQIYDTFAFSSLASALHSSHCVFVA